MAIEKKKLNKFLSDFTEGKKIELPAKASFTKDEEQAVERLKDFSGDGGEVPVLIIIPNSKSGVDITEWSSAKNEKEVLVPKGSSYKVKEVKNKKGQIIITLEDENNNKTNFISGR